MKTREELNALKEEVETLKGKLAELTDEELAQVSGGDGGDGGAGVVVQPLQQGAVTVNDGNCGDEVEIYGGKCKFHPDGINPNCNTTCKYYCKT